VYIMNVPRLTRAGLVAPLTALATPAARFAALTGLLTASYSVVDKWTIDSGVPAAWYAYLTIPVAALLLTPWAWSHPRRTIEWHAPRGAIGAVAVLMTTSYLLVLLALRTAPVSHVAPAREVAIVFGAILGALVLREAHARQRVLGAILIVIGVALLAHAPAA